MGSVSVFDGLMKFSSLVLLLQEETMLLLQKIGRDLSKKYGQNPTKQQ